MGPYWGRTSAAMTLPVGSCRRYFVRRVGALGASGVRVSRRFRLLVRPPRHPMRGLGSSGVWETVRSRRGRWLSLQIPDPRCRTVCGATRLIRWRSRSEAPPATASVVYHLDSYRMERRSNGWPSGQEHRPGGTRLRCRSMRSICRFLAGRASSYLQLADELVKAYLLRDRIHPRRVLAGRRATPTAGRGATRSLPTTRRTARFGSPGRVPTPGGCDCTRPASG